MTAPTTTPITEAFDIFEKLGSNTTIQQGLIAALQLTGDSQTSFMVSEAGNKINGTISSTGVITVTFAQIEFMNVGLIISNLVLDPTSETLTLDATPIPPDSGPWNLSDSLPDIACFKMLDGLIQNAVFSYSFAATTSGQTTTISKNQLSFSGDISTSGGNLGTEASAFLSFFGTTGFAQQLLFDFEGGLIGDKMKLSGTIDFANPIATKNDGKVPKIALTAALTSSTDNFKLFNFLSVNSPRVTFTTVPSEAVAKGTTTPLTAAIVPSFELGLNIGDSSAPVLLNLKTAAPPTDGAMTFVATNEAAQPVTLPQIFNLMAGHSWDGLIPGPLQKLMMDVGLQSFTAAVKFPESGVEGSTFELSSIVVTAETTQAFSMPSPLKDSNCMAAWTIDEPLDEDKRKISIDFTANSELHLKGQTKVPLALTIQSDS